MRYRDTLFAFAVALVVWTAAASPAAASPVFQISLSTHSLASSGVFALDFQLTDGSGLGDATTTISLSDFSGVFDEPGDFVGGAGGDISNVVTLTDNTFFGAFTIGFEAGIQVALRMQRTTSLTLGSTPDLFSIFLLQLELADGTPVMRSFPLLDLEFSASPQFVLFGVQALAVDAPIVTVVPEPTVLALLGVTCAVLWSARRPRRSAASERQPFGANNHRSQSWRACASTSGTPFAR